MDRAARSLTVAWAVTLATLVAATWPLWSLSRGTPRVAPCAALGFDPGAGELALVAAVAIALVRAACNRRPRAAIAAGTLALAALLAPDQLRWQAWAYHALLVGAVLALSPSHAPRLLRWVAVSVYAFSAIAKLDAEFAATLGPQVVRALAGPLGLDPRGTGLSAAALALPLGELGVAALLAGAILTPRLRGAACVAVVTMHAVTLLAIGPWGLGHSAGVLLWNVGFAWQTVGLFRDGAPAAPTGRGAGDWLAYGVAGFAALAPAAVPLGMWDAWPGWALYAPGGERATLFAHDRAVDRLPEGLRRFVDPPEPAGPWRRVRLNDWALAENLAPIYPQNRVVAAIALDLAQRRGLAGSVRVVAESAAGRWSRQRTATPLDTPEQLAAAARFAGLPLRVVGSL